jgi:RNA polymerase sigma factor (sigma-70 family)
MGVREHMSVPEHMGVRHTSAPEPLGQLIDRARARDTPAAVRQAAFGVLVERFQDAAYSYAAGALGDPHLAWDAAQEAFLTAYRSLDQLRTPAAFPGWLRRIVRTHCRRLQRSRQPHVASLDALAALDPSAWQPVSRLDSQTDPEAAAERWERGAAIASALRTLPAGQRVVTVLFYVGGYPQHEIAELLRVPLTTVKKRMQAARKHLQVRMVNVMEADAPQQRHGSSAPPGLAQLLRMARWLTAVAAADCDHSLLELLLMDGLDVNTPDANGRTLLSWAAQRGQVAMLACLLARGAAVNARDRAGRTPLAWAERAQRQPAAAFLRRAGGVR